MLKALTLILALLSCQALYALESSACLAAPPIDIPSTNTINIANEAELQSAMQSLTDGTTLVLSPGEYNLSRTLYIKRKNITITGANADCSSTVLLGKGMDNAVYGQVQHAIWSNAENLKIYNLSIRDIYDHPIILNYGAHSTHIYNVRLSNAGAQFIKSNPKSFGDGNNNGKVEYTIMEYTNTPPLTDHGAGLGYMNGVDVHAGANWVIRNNLFKNFHTADNAQYLWNPAILMWNGAVNTLSENNTFINVDRAIAYGLIDRNSDHAGGIIRNNMIYYSPNLYSSQRKANSDAAIIVWDSPNTKVLHNTILSNNNLNKAIEFRFNTTGSEAINNLVDGIISSRNGGSFLNQSNYTNASAELFVNAAIGDLHLKETATKIIDKTHLHSDAEIDIDGTIRLNNQADYGADEYQGSVSPPMPPSHFEASALLL